MEHERQQGRGEKERRKGRSRKWNKKGEEEKGEEDVNMREGGAIGEEKEK